MIEIQRILCPIDFSDASRHALAHAVAIGKWFHAHITALHVFQPAFMLEPPVLAGGVPVPMDTGLTRQSLKEELRGAIEQASRAGVKTDMRFEDGNPVRHILERARLLPADLIVIGTHGVEGVERFMLGSVAEKVLRKAACPVMTVPARAATVAKLPYERLLCPVDFSEPSRHALQFAFSLAEEADAQLTVLHVIDWPSDDEELLVARFDAKEFRQVVDETIGRRLEALVPDDVRVYCRPATKIAYGKPYRQILEVAQTERADLIVIGLHGRNPLDLTLLGSTTNHVVRSAPCPVLTMKR